jgi:hypothetical protein
MMVLECMCLLDESSSRNSVPSKQDLYSVTRPWVSISMYPIVKWCSDWRAC